MLCAGSLDVVNPRHACAARVTALSLSFRLSVCPPVVPSVCLLRYQRVQCHTGYIFKMAFLVKMLRSKVMARKQSERANYMQISTGLPRPALRTLEAPEVATQGECRLPCAIYQCNKPVTDSQREATTSSKWTSPPINSTAHAYGIVCTSSASTHLLPLLTY